MRGADPVNDELEVGFNAAFEVRWHRAKLFGRAIMLAFVTAAAIGLLGNGPLDHHTSYALPGPLHVDYEPAVRYGTGTQVTFHLGSAAPGTGTTEVFLGSSFVEPFGLQQIVPQPLLPEATHDGMVLTFPAAARRLRCPGACDGETGRGGPGWPRGR